MYCQISYKLRILILIVTRYNNDLKSDVNPLLNPTTKIKPITGMNYTLNDEYGFRDCLDTDHGDDVDPDRNFGQLITGFGETGFL